jgi:hypothetical protein
MNVHTVQVLESLERLSPRFVTVNDDVILRNAKDQALGDFPFHHWNEKGINPENNDVFVSHTFFESCVNFCFGYRALDSAGRTLAFSALDAFAKRRVGSAAMMACFYRKFGETPITAEAILFWTKNDARIRSFFSGLFLPIPLLEERRLLLRAAAEVLKEKYDGDPRNILEAGRYRAFGTDSESGILDILINDFPVTFGSDAVTINAASHKLFFPFHKRAQLFLMIYHGRAVNAGGFLREISDAADLGPIADYELPKIHRVDGELTYSPELAELVDNSRDIEPGSREEIEIRASDESLMELKLAAINKTRLAFNLPPITMAQLDTREWLRGWHCREARHHLCFTSNY